MGVFSEYSSEINATELVPIGTDVQFAWVGLLIIIECLLAILTVGANIFVMLAFVNDEKIHSKTSNYYLLNLSASDLVVGINMFVNLAWWICGGKWVFGETFCKVYMVMDYSSVFVSVTTVIAISVDRLQLVKDPVSYHERQSNRQTRNKVILVNACIWLFVVVFYGCIAFGWKELTGERPVDYDNFCALETFENFYFTLPQALLEFVIPLSVLISINVSVYINLWKRSKKLQLRSKFKYEPKDFSSFVKDHTSRFTSDQNNAMEDVSHVDQTKSPKNKILVTSNGSTQEHYLDGFKLHQNNSMENRSGSLRFVPNQNVTNSNLLMLEKIHKHNRETRKAAHRLSFLVVVFTVTLMPYYISSLISAFWGYAYVSDLTWEIVSLLLWSNSTWNPFIYAVISPHFRRNFARYLRCRI